MGSLTGRGCLGMEFTGGGWCIQGSQELLVLREGQVDLMRVCSGTI